jgi:aminopeptidase N
MSRPVAKGADGYLEQEGALDVAFYIVAHEAGHQWWGNIVMPGKGPGGNIISEGLAEFSALMLLHHELGDEQAKTLRRRWEKQHTEGRRADNERPINRTDGTRPGDQVVTYPRAGFVFWMLRDLMGEEQMLAGLKAFVAKWKNGIETPEGLDFPLIEDMVESLRPFAPNEVAFNIFIDQWIYGTTLPEFELDDVKVDGTEGACTTAVELRNVGKGTVDVTVRALGEDAAQFEDTVVRVAAGGSVPVVIRSAFKPAKLVVDPEVRLLFAGRKRCEKSL